MSGKNIFIPQEGYGHGISFPVYKADQFLYAVGHTPMREVTLKDSVLSCDVFSTHSDRRPFENNHFVILDTEAKQYTEYEVMLKCYARD